MALPPVYNPQEIESRWYSRWERSGAFAPRPDAEGEPFTIVIPPPNVTGILHMGHALNNTLQDVLIRHRRMTGVPVLWVPGTDHAGIATQNVVERRLAKEGITRRQLGREEFVRRVWQWRGQYGSTIARQLRRLGASCDWSRERFTMDEGLCRAVEEAFLTLYEAGLIYRGYRLVNWCPRCHTALSDEEVEHQEMKAKLWHIRYLFDPQPVPGAGTVPGTDRGLGIVVATTRPETLLGDVAVAVHPEDERYRDHVGRTVRLPLTGRTLPIIADEAVGREFGTGAVKITPAHDPADFEMARRHPELIPKEAPRGEWMDVPIRVMDPDGRMTNVPKGYEGMDRFECRKAVLRDLEAQGLLAKTEDYTTSVGHCYRCKTVVEPMLSPQWFVKMRPLAELGIEAVEKEGLRFIPERWTRVYLDWLKNIRDWCISRQIWWGHRIPIWYHPPCRRPEEAGRGRWEEGKYLEPGMAVAREEEIRSGAVACPTCGKTAGWVQDPDVLDTWFSSWLWPFSTLGWPEETPDLKRFYPTSALVTGQDIIFFWVARMVMAGKFFLKRIPFRDVYIHGIIRVEGGKKMSKSLGNIIDPLDVIERMGADGLRFSIVHMTSEGQDLYLSEERFLLGRNFANKLWNAARLILESPSPSEGKGRGEGAALTLADRWILSRLQRTVESVSGSLERYQFSEAARRLYHFVWRELCDWYLEVAKLQKGLSPQGSVPGGASVDRTDQVLLETLETVLRLLHPLMPFLTEELWQKIPATARPRRLSETILHAPWPEVRPERIDAGAEAAFERLQAVITGIREIRAAFRLKPSQEVDLKVRAADGAPLLEAHARILRRLGRVGKIEIGPAVERPDGSAVAHVGDWDLVVPLADLVDLEVERRRIEREVDQIRARVAAKQKRLGDPRFRNKAPREVVAQEELSLREAEAALAKWSDSLRQIR